MLYDALIPSLEEVGARFERGDYFVPEMLIAARAMQGALDILRPLLAETGTARSARSSWARSRATSTTSARTSATSCSRARASPSSTSASTSPPEKFVEADRRAQARRRRLLGVPHDDDADVQGEHQRAREVRHPRRGDRHGRRRPRHPGVRRRRRRRRLLRGRSSAVKKAKALIEERRSPRAGDEACSRPSSTRSRARSGTAGCAGSASCTPPA